MFLMSHILNTLATDFIEPVPILKDVFVSVKKQTDKSKKMPLLFCSQKKLHPRLLLGILKFMCVTLHQIC